MYKAALKIKGTSSEYQAEATYQLAVCYQKSGFMDSARRRMREVAEHYSDTDWAKKARGMLYVWDTYGSGAK